MSFANSTAEFGQAAAQWQKLWTDSWGQMAKSTVSSESFAAASGAYMDWTLSTQKMVAEMSGQVMETLDMPRRSDLARLAAQVQSVETRLLDQEEANEDIRDLLVALNAKLDRLAAAKEVPTAAPAVSEPVSESALKEAVSQASSEFEVVRNGSTDAFKPAKPGRKSGKKGNK